MGSRHLGGGRAGARPSPCADGGGTPPADAFFTSSVFPRLAAQAWTPFSDRKVRVGIAGEGVCNFGSAFAY